jgi:N-acetylneuraminate lyase
VPPYYYSYRRAAVVDYVREVAGATSLPFLYYHIPARTGVELDEPLARELMAVPGVRGVKYSAVDLAFQERLQAWGGPSFAVFCGADDMLLASLAMGAAGAIGSTYNFLAPRFLRLWHAFRAGQLGEAQRLQVELNRVIAVLARCPNIAVSKEVLRLTGLDPGRPRRPQSQLTAEESARLAAELEAAGFQGAA